MHKTTPARQKTLYEYYIGQAIKGVCANSRFYSAHDMAEMAISVVDHVFNELQRKTPPSNDSQ